MQTAKPVADGQEGSRQGGGHACSLPSGPASLARAHEVCRTRGVRLTSSRFSVLSVLQSAHRPLGAYDLADLLGQKTGKRVAAITIYRALDFLLEHGLIHRLETRNAFVICPGHHEAQSAVVFFICERCGAAQEADASSLQNMLSDLAKTADFAPHAPVIEVPGVCAVCQDCPA